MRRVQHERECTIVERSEGAVQLFLLGPLIGGSNYWVRGGLLSLVEPTGSKFLEAKVCLWTHFNLLVSVTRA